jgi:hypothetical protein
MEKSTMPANHPLGKLLRPPLSQLGGGSIKPPKTIDITPIIDHGRQDPGTYPRDSFMRSLQAAVRVTFDQNSSCPNSRSPEITPPFFHHFTCREWWRLVKEQGLNQGEVPISPN